MSCDKYNIKRYMLGIMTKPTTLSLKALNLKPSTENPNPKNLTQNAQLKSLT